MNRQGLVTIAIKAWNEAAHIDRAIASAWAARHEVWPRPLEIVVADGLSSDGTAERALAWSRQAPVRVVQLVRAQDRGCGAGVELGWAWSQGEWVMLMDGDMVLLPGFLGAALAHLERHPERAGVGGTLQDVGMANATDRIRVRNGLGSQIGLRPWLEGGGLYRRSAIESADGHAADVRLAAFEEADLGVRLRRAGWTLERLPIPAVRHHGHAQGTARILLNRWRSGRLLAAGRLLRLHLGRRGGASVCRLMAHPLAVGGGWLTLGAAWWLEPGGSPLWGPAVVVGAGAGATAVQLWRKRDAHHVMAAWLDWHLMLAGLVLGGLRPLPQRPPAPASRLLGDDPRNGVVDTREAA